MVTTLLPTPFAGTYTLDQIAQAHPGWRAVFWTGVRHTTKPVAVLCLATNSASSTPGLMVTLTYSPDTGWLCCETDPTYCGLLPPGRDLGWYEALDPNGHVPQGTPA